MLQQFTPSMGGGQLHVVRWQRSMFIPVSNVVTILGKFAALMGHAVFGWLIGGAQ